MTPNLTLIPSEYGITHVLKNKCFQYICVSYLQAIADMSTVHCVGMVYKEGLVTYYLDGQPILLDTKVAHGKIAIVSD